ncbi:MAG: hypothetical protein ABIP93_10360 [Gemmatimonadaceae bacterium]
MRIVSLIVALVSVVACGGGATQPASPSVVGVWSLQTYNGNPLPYTGTPEQTPGGIAINQATGGELEFGGGSYTVSISIIRTVNGTQVFNQNYSEIGTYTATSTGVVMRPFDIPGSSPSQAAPAVSATVSGSTISFLQQGKPLTFVKR